MIIDKTLFIITGKILSNEFISKKNVQIYGTAFGEVSETCLFINTDTILRLYPLPAIQSSKKISRSLNYNIFYVYVVTI